jgi:hypothetical protein
MPADDRAPEFAQLLSEWQAANARAAALIKEADFRPRGSALVELEAAELAAASIARRFIARDLN